MRNSRSAGLASMMAAAAISMIGAGMAGNGAMQANVIQATPSGVSTKQQPAERTKAPRGLDNYAGLFGGFGSGSRGRNRARGPGWTNAHAKRVARKTRAVKAHRARSKS